MLSLVQRLVATLRRWRQPSLSRAMAEQIISTMKRIGFARRMLLAKPYFRHRSIRTMGSAKVFCVAERTHLAQASNRGVIMDVMKLKMGTVVVTKSGNGYCWLYNPHLESWMFHKINAGDTEAIWFTLTEIIDFGGEMLGNILTSSCDAADFIIEPHESGKLGLALHASSRT